MYSFKPGIKAGRLAELDVLASKFFSAAKDARNSIYEEAVIVADNIGSTSQHYLRAMQKLVNGTEGYLEKETARCVSKFSFTFWILKLTFLFV